MCIMFINIIRSSITVKSGEQPKFLIRVHGKYKLYVTWTRYNVKNKNISNVVILSAPALNFLNVCTSISKLTEVQCYCVHQYSTYLITWSRLINTKKKALSITIIEIKILWMIFTIWKFSQEITYHIAERFNQWIWVPSVLLSRRVVSLFVRSSDFLRKTKKKLPRPFNFTFHVIDDIPSLNNYWFGDFVDRIY